MAQDETIPPTIRAFLHVALRKHLSITPRSERAARKQIIKDYLKIRTGEAAREYIQTVRRQLREAKASRRKTLIMTQP